MSKEVLLLPGPDPGTAVTCSVFQALIQCLHRAESCTCHSLHKPTFGPNATEQYAKLLLGMCAAAVRVSRETFVSVTPNGHFAGLIFLSRDSPGGRVNGLHFRTENSLLHTCRRAAYVQGEAKHPPLSCKKVLWGCRLLLLHWWKSVLPLHVWYFVCPALTDLCPSVLSNKVVESCCLAKTGKCIMAINIAFRTSWLTKRLKQEG